MGDAWMIAPLLAKLSEQHEIEIVCGTYSLPVFEWVLNNIIGARYRIVWVVSDPDSSDSEYCPGYGYHSILAARKMVEEQMPGRQFLELDDVGSLYNKVPDCFRLNGTFPQGEHIVIHPSTRHEWKNVGTFHFLEFKRPIKIVGLEDEYRCRAGEEFVQGFDDQVKAVLTSAGVVGQLSCYSNLASLAGKPQIVTSFTEDWNLAINPKARVLINPSPAQVQEVIDEMGL
jgi:hypothetical protein